MPNIPFLTLIYLLLAVPGFLYRSFYHSGEFTRNLLPRSWTDDIVKAILYSIPFHLFWIGIIELGQRFGITKHTITFETIFRLMAAEYSVHDYSFHGISSRLYENALYLLGYYVLVLLTSIGAGLGAQRLVWNNELDVHWPWLKYRSEWLYRIMGRGQLPNVPQEETDAWIDILSEQDSIIPGKSVLYHGLAAGYTTEENGALRDIILTNVKRTAGEKKMDGELKWTPIPGRFLVVSYAKVRNLNITYEQHSMRLLRQISDLPAGPMPAGPAQPPSVAPPSV
jgi:hypothetical protein